MISQNKKIRVHNEVNVPKILPPYGCQNDIGKRLVFSIFLLNL